MKTKETVNNSMEDSEIAGIQANGWHSKASSMAFADSVGVASTIYFIASY